MLRYGNHGSNRKVLKTHELAVTEMSESSAIDESSYSMLRSVLVKGRDALSCFSRPMQFLSDTC
jgi:hypothetical protein